MIGVITNSRDWIFTRYDMQAEFGIGKGLDDYKQRTEKDRNHEFEFSETFTIFKVNEEDNTIVFNPSQLANVVKILEKLQIYYIGIE